MGSGVESLGSWLLDITWVLLGGITLSIRFVAKATVAAEVRIEVSIFV